MENNLLSQVIARKNCELRCKDRNGKLYLAIWSRTAKSIPVELCSVELENDDIDFFASMLTDKIILNDYNSVDLKEPIYPCIIRVVWREKGVLIRFVDWDQEGRIIASIDISHAQRLKVAQMAKRIVFINHFLLRLGGDG